jgi:acyl-coenzyme A thioesterase PaaI-like protein
MGLDDDIALRPAGAGEYEASIVEHWWTPRGPLGGYVMAIVHRGMELAVNDSGREPRSLNVYFLRPPHAGSITVRPVVERVGRSLTTVSARLEQDGKLIALGVAAFSAPWPGPELSEAPMPAVDPPAERATVEDDGPGLERRPPFMGRLTMQRRFGDRAFSGSEHAETGGWLGLIEERPVDAATLLVLADAWYPAPWPRLKALAPAPTIEMSVMFRSPLPLPDSLVLGRFHSRLVRDGFFDEQGELWTPEGTLVAQSRQLALLIGGEA